jgi:DNA-binding response OmpR family regulator
MRVLLLEDDLFLAELIAEHLQERGFAVIRFDNGEEAGEYMYENGIDLALFDIGVPGMTGEELLAAIRMQKRTTPVIVITADGDPKRLKRCFELGCDDYIKKPFSFEELDARIDHVIRLYALEHQEIEIDSYLFDPKRKVLSLGDEIFHLTPKEANILLYLFRHKGRIVSKEELVQNLWTFEEEPPTDATIRTYIKNLRRFFPNIVTYRGEGYAFE